MKANTIKNVSVVHPNAWAETMHQWLLPWVENQGIEIESLKAYSPLKKKFLSHILDQNKFALNVPFGSTEANTCTAVSTCTIKLSYSPEQASCIWTVCCSLARTELQITLGDIWEIRLWPEVIQRKLYQWKWMDGCIPMSRNILGTVWITSVGSPKYYSKINPALPPKSR